MEEIRCSTTDTRSKSPERLRTPSLGSPPASSPLWKEGIQTGGRARREMNVSQKIKANQYGGPRKLKGVMRAGVPAEGGGGPNVCLFITMSSIFFSKAPIHYINYVMTNKILHTTKKKPCWHPFNNVWRTFPFGTNSLTEKCMPNAHHNARAPPTGLSCQKSKRDQIKQNWLSSFTNN